MSRYVNIDDLKIDFRESVRTDFEARINAPFINIAAVTVGQIMKAPSIDIVHCRECKNWVGHDDNEEFWDECRWRDDESPNPDDFCSYGEREGE